jgi:hypothetical protein
MVCSLSLSDVCISGEVGTRPNFFLALSLTRMYCAVWCSVEAAGAVQEQREDVRD